ncbi:MAG TPA: hypothetical protein VG942_19420 [Hyphomonadaceae bacterium]|nr:hypothetical protein [Hyphomonadaceae bacterium]
MTIWISSLAQAPRTVERIRPSHVVSLLSPYDDFPVFAALGEDRHLQIGIHDINQDIGDWRAPGARDVERLIGFVEAWDRADPILIHCWAGISRSTASAFITACVHNPKADEEEIAQAIREASETAFPNRRLVSHADAILGRNGRMSAAIDAIGRGAIAEEAAPFSIPSVFGA